MNDSRRRLKKNQYEIVKTWLSSFVVTAAVIVAVTLFIPKSPEAKILKSEGLLNMITYQVAVTDEAQALKLDSLMIVLENQLERYEVSIGLGETSGYFENLKDNTDYRLSVYGNKGFGQEKLDSVVVKTKDSPGGYILGYRPVGDPMEPFYEVDVFINDPESMYQSISLYYGYTYDDQPFYQFTEITQNRETVELMHLFGRTHLYLEAITSSGAIVLDEMWLTPTFRLYSSFYLDRVDKNQLDLSLYHSSDGSVDVTYKVDLFEGNQKRFTQTIPSKDLEGYEHRIIFTNLKAQTSYRVVATATYINPSTLREETVTLLEEDVTTLSDYQVTYTITTSPMYLDVNITVVDPSHLFQVPYVEIYDISGEYPIWLYSETYSFTPAINSKSVQFNILLPDVAIYRIVIGIRNQQYYIIRHVIHDEIYHKE
jgi:hypothetical protein